MKSFKTLAREDFLELQLKEVQKENSELRKQVSVLQNYVEFLTEEEAQRQETETDVEAEEARISLTWFQP